MVIGFTGTRKGMSAAQKRQFADVLLWLIQICALRHEPISFHHGAARGSDTEAAFMVEDADADVLIVPHPAVADPLVRNRSIANLCSILIAAPDGDMEKQRSGTWATVRYARAAGRPIVMLSRGKS